MQDLVPVEVDGETKGLEPIMSEAAKYAADEYKEVSEVSLGIAETCFNFKWYTTVANYIQIACVALNVWKRSDSLVLFCCSN